MLFTFDKYEIDHASDGGLLTYSRVKYKFLQVLLEGEQHERTWAQPLSRHVTSQRLLRAGVSQVAVPTARLLDRHLVFASEPALSH